MPSELAARGEVKRPPRRRGLFSFWVRGSAGLVHVVDKSRVRLIPSRRRRRSVAAPSSHHAAPVAARRSIARVRFDTPRDARPHRSPRRASVRLPLGRVRTIDRASSIASKGAHLRNRSRPQRVRRRSRCRPRSRRRRASPRRDARARRAAARRRSAPRRPRRSPAPRGRSPRHPAEARSPPPGRSALRICSPPSCC